MKAQILSLILPVAAFMLASAGAVGTKMAQSQNSGVPPETGWSRNANNHCLVPTQCRTEVGPICTIPAGAQAFGMVAPNQCTKTLYKLQ